MDIFCTHAQPAAVFLFCRASPAGKPACHGEKIFLIDYTSDKMKGGNVKMKFGLCSGLDKMAQAKQLGYDYLELAVNSIAAMTDEEFDAALAQAKEIGLPVPSFNCLFPGSIALLAPETTDQEIADYLHGAFKRVQALGGKVVVFGSGRSRNRPDGMDYGAAFRRLVEVARIIGDIAGQYGITAVVEPLNRSETNTINSMAEGAALVAAANHPHMKLLCDYYHVARDNEPLTDIVRLGGVAHTHIATLEGRRHPVEEGPDQFRLFFRCLRETNYQGLMSVEGKTDDLAADAPRTLKLLRKLDEEA